MKFTPKSHEVTPRPVVTEFRRIAIVGANPAVKGCVYKMSYDSRYVVIKAKGMANSVAAIQKALNQFIRQAPSQHKKDNLYYHLFKYVQANPGKTFEIELILEDESPYALLRTEHAELKRAVKDKKCLNNNTDAYLPAYNEETGNYGWIPKADYLNYKRWAKRADLSEAVRKPTNPHKVNKG